jgi:Mg/Co/Ni transporter MgtE
MLKVLAEMVIGSLLGPVLFIAFLLLIAWFARRVLGL